MVKKSASLAGRGVEILFGEARPEGEDLASEASAPSSFSAEGDALPQEEAVMGGEEELDAEWVAMLEAEAEAATAEVEGEVPTAQPAAGPQAPQAVPVHAGETAGEAGLPGPSTVQPREELPPLATTPAQPVEALPPLATTPAQPEPVSGPAAGTGVAPDLGIPEGPGTYAPPGAVSAPAYPAETPPAPTYSEPSVSAVEPSAPLPPPREKTDAIERIERIRLSGTLYDTPVSGAALEELEPSGPQMPELVAQEVAEYEKDQVSRVRGEEEIVEYVGPKQRQDLWKEIVALYEEVPQVLSTHEQQPLALRLLQEAQDLLMERPRQFDVAKYKVGQVKGILERRRNIVRWTNTWAWLVFVYDLVWILIFGYAIFFFQPSFQAEALVVLWNTMLWGGVGGVINGFYGLYRHASEIQDFDKQYVMWYVAQPMIGMLLGAVVHLIIGTGFLSARGETGSGQETVVSLFPYLVACIGGFQQRFVLRLIVRVIELFTPPEAEAPPASTEQQ